VVEAVLLRPFPYPDAGRLVILNHRDRRTGITKEFIAIGDYLDLTQRQSSLESIGAYGNGQSTLFGVGEPFRVETLGAGPGLLETLGAHPAMGRGIQPSDARPGAPPVVLLSYELWQTRFGSDPQIIGRGIKLGQTERQIVGVAPPGFRFPPATRTDVIVPETLPVEAPAERKSGWVFAIARLKPGVPLSEAGASLSTLSRQMEQEHPRSNLGSEYFAISLRDALVGNTKPALILMLAAVTVVLIIACANVANLLLARSLARRREMALRVALGAGRGRLTAQLLTESLVLATVAGMVGIAIAHWGARALVTLVPKSVSVPGIADVHINGGVLAFALGITLLTALVFGLVSAATLRTRETAGIIAASNRASMSTRARRAASVLVAMEIAFAIVLLIGAGLIMRSFSRLLSVDPGFRTNNVMTLDVQMPADRYRDPEARRALFTRAFTALEALPSVQISGAGVVTPLTGNNWTTSLERPEKPLAPGERPPEVGWQVASGGYFRALQIPVLSGRLFDARDAAGARSVIISEAVEKQYFPNEHAVGREIKSGDGRWQIVGVVGNIRRAGLRDDPRADLYFPFERDPSNRITLFVRTSSNPLALLPSMQNALRSIEPNVVFVESLTMSAIAGQSLEVTNLALWLLGLFAITSLALAAVGIYSVMSYVVRQRTREIGTRVALGATRRDIEWMVMRQGIGIAALGTTIGLAAGLVAARSLSSILYGISAGDPATAAASAAFLVLTTMAACYLPARGLGRPCAYSRRTVSRIPRNLWENSSGITVPIRVNGETLDDQEIAEEARAMLPRLAEVMAGESRGAVLARAKEWARENVIERALLRQAAIADPEPVSEPELQAAIEKLGLKDRPAACLNKDTPGMTDAEVAFRIDRLQQRLSAKLQPPKSKEIGEYFKKNAGQFCAPEMVRAAHIVKNIDERTDEASARAAIEEIAAKLTNGADFAQLADELSDCPGKGGDLGFFPRGSMVPEFERVVFAMSPGQTSTPFRTPFGYHVAKLLEYSPARALTFPEVRDRIADALYTAKRQRAVERYLDHLRANAVIET